MSLYIVQYHELLSYHMRVLQRSHALIMLIQFVYQECFIDEPENSEWFEKYQYHIPVIHLNGKFLMMHRVDEDKLARALSTANNES